MDAETYDTLSKLNLPKLRPMRLNEVEDGQLLAVKPGRTFGEYCWTITPSLINHVLDHAEGAQRVTYLDADCFFFSDPARILSELDASGKAVLVTPHDYSAEHDQSTTSGRFCVQFVTFSDTADSREILRTWRSQCIEWCFDRIEPDRFGDQKYLDPWPDRYPSSVHVLRDTALTLAPWNVTKHLERIDDACMYHFHGLRVRRGGEVRLFEGYPVPEDVVRDIYEPYVVALERASALATSSIADFSVNADKLSWGARYSEYRLRSKGLLGVRHLRPDSVSQASPEPDIRIGSGAAIALAAQGVGLLSSVIISVLVARALGPAGKGALSVVQQVVAIVLVLTNLGISTANIYFVSKREVLPGVAAGNSLAMSGVVTILAAVPISILLYGPFAVLPGMPLRVAVAAVIAFSTSQLLSWFGSVVVGVRGLRPQGVATLVSATTTTVLVGSLALFADRLSVSAVVLAGACGSAAALATMGNMARGRIGRLSVDFGVMLRTARYSARVHLAGLADFLHVRLDMLLLGWLAGSASVGIYSVGVSFAELAWYLPNALGQSIQAQASRVSHESALDTASRGLRLAVVITLLIALGLVAIVPWLLPLLFGDDFSQSVTVFLVLLPGAALNGLASIALYYQLSRGIVYWRVSLFALVVNVAANLILAPKFGALGAAVASTVSYSLYFGWIVRRMARDSQLRLRQLLVPTRADVEILIGAARSYARR